jgi:hypothetical protein
MISSRKVDILPNEVMLYTDLVQLLRTLSRVGGASTRKLPSGVFLLLLLALPLLSSMVIGAKSSLPISFRLR